MRKLVKLNNIKSNPKNPRVIKNDKFNKLVKSIKEFPEMLKLRPIVVDENMIVLGGNMRLKASKEAGLKEVWIDIAEGLTQKQKDEFIVKDNVGFGEWEWNLLANEWNSNDLVEWGLDVWQNIDDIEVSDDFSLPENEKEPYQQMTFTLADQQVEFIKEQIKFIKSAKSNIFDETFGNENMNGNAIYEIVKEWVEQRK
jgi:hypothetical protein|tara:strand:+ start:5690 stop:6283 length:594 start_codon:yes stop_codon:yes gene_type:complete